MREDYKRRLIAKSIAGDARVVTNPVASPTGFPFKVAKLEGTASEFRLHGASAHLRSWIPTGAIQAGRRRNWLSLLRRTRSPSMCPRTAKSKIRLGGNAYAMR